jgi:hypothetical protein
VNQSDADTEAGAEGAEFSKRFPVVIDFQFSWTGPRVTKVLGNTQNGLQNRRFCVYSGIGTFYGAFRIAVGWSPSKDRHDSVDFHGRFGCGSVLDL